MQFACKARAEDKFTWIMPNRSRKYAILSEIIAEPPPVICSETARQKVLIYNFLQGGILFFDNFRQ